MAKMRVHELAKELNIKSQDVIQILSTTEFAVKSASSGLEEPAQDVVRKKFAAAAEKPKVADTPKAETVKTPAKAEAPKTEKPEPTVSLKEDQADNER